MEENKIRIGITQGDINGVGYEVILKTFSDPTMLELCTPIIYGSPKVAAYHRKALDVQANFSIVNTASEAGYNRLSVVNCTDDEVKVEFSKPDPEAGKAALGALERAIEEYREGLIDVIVTAPINKHTIQSEEFSFPGHTEYIEERLGNGNKSLMILMKNDFRRGGPPDAAGTDKMQGRPRPKGIKAGPCILPLHFGRGCGMALPPPRPADRPRDDR